MEGRCNCGGISDHKTIIKVMTEEEKLKAIVLELEKRVFTNKPLSQVLAEIKRISNL